MRDLERELRALPRPEPSPELDQRIERLHAAAPPRGAPTTVSAARKRTMGSIRAAALLLVGLLLGRATAPSGQSTATSPAPPDTGPRSPTLSIDTRPIEPPESPGLPRADDEPPLFAATNVRQLLARAATAQRSTAGAPPLLVPPRNARSAQQLRPTPLHE